jgi:hypothetical protein
METEYPQVYEGYRHRGGQLVPELGLVFVVPRKVDKEELRSTEVVPSRIDGVLTDVIEVAEYSIPPISTQEYNQRRRPCPGGFSIGHVDITAGTFGAPVKQTSEDWLALTNNHVAANSNDANEGDPILQPGPHDGGQMDSDRWGTLHSFVEINFRGLPPIKKNNTVARAWWGFIKGLGNSGAKLTNCPYRVQVGRQAIQQPTPNTVDVALVSLIEQGWVAPTVHQLGEVQGIRDAVVGMNVHKSGRTTETTHGVVVGVNGSVSVNYGGGRVADFAQQVIIEGNDGDFSAGGDSGSAILDDENFLVGVLFAGGGGQTIACPISEVVRLLGIRVA